MRYSLRLQTFQDVLNDTFRLDLPVVFSGTKEECETYAKERGFEWRSKPLDLFGGWWYKRPSEGFEGECLLPDTETPGKGT